MKAKNEEQASYNTTVQQLSDEGIIARALEILSKRVAKGDVMSNPATVRQYLMLTMANREHEVFCVTFLDARNRVIVHEEMFRGTLTQTSVYPREIVKAALKHNAASVLLSHNHPSGNPDPSRADEMLTRALREALALVDVKVLDHIIVAGAASTSFAERGLRKRGRRTLVD